MRSDKSLICSGPQNANNSIEWHCKYHIRIAAWTWWWSYIWTLHIRQNKHKNSFTLASHICTNVYNNVRTKLTNCLSAIQQNTKTSIGIIHHIELVYVYVGYMKLQYTPQDDENKWNWYFLQKILLNIAIAWTEFLTDWLLNWFSWYVLL